MLSCGSETITQYFFEKSHDFSQSCWEKFYKFGSVDVLQIKAFDCYLLCSVGSKE